MKFVHIADIHFDTNFDNLKNKKYFKDRRKEEQIQAFKKVIQYVEENDVEFLFISGDLFEQEHVKVETIEFIISEIKKIPNTKVFISPGNHDPLINNSPYVMFEWPENVYIFGSDVGKYDFEDISIYGIGFDRFEMESSTISDIDVDKNKVNILITHCTLNGGSKKYHDIKEVELKKFDYCALRSYSYAKG